MRNRKHESLILAIFGPTAVGKSRVAAAVAAAAGGEVVSADSMQVYRGLPILTDQPGTALLELAPHHLIAHVGLDEEYSAARYAGEAETVIAGLLERGALPVLAGGTGLYVRSVLGGFDFPGEGDRERWRRFVEEEGVEAAFAELERLDPEAATAIDRHNPRRLMRALEIAEASPQGWRPRRDRLWSGESHHGETLCFALELERGELYRRIDRRVGRMVELGVLEEVRKARRGKVSRTASQAIGFAALCDHLDGRLTLDEALEVIRRDSRRYAKRQLTWMRKMPDVVRIELTGSAPEAVVERIVGSLEKRRRA